MSKMVPIPRDRHFIDLWRDSVTIPVHLNGRGIIRIVFSEKEDSEVIIRNS